MIYDLTHLSTAELNTAKEFDFIVWPDGAVSLLIEEKDRGLVLRIIGSAAVRQALGLPSKSALIWRAKSRTE
jgi:hypothetical protein